MTKPENNTLEISRMLTISTGHLRPATMEALDAEPETNRIGLIVYPKSDFGWFLYISDDNMAVCQKDILEQDYPDLAECIRYAKEQNCSVICFDCDASFLMNLTIYDDE